MTCPLAKKELEQQTGADSPRDRFHCLQRLLGNSGFTYRRVNARTLTVEPLAQAGALNLEPTTVSSQQDSVGSYQPPATSAIMRSQVPNLEIPQAINVVPAQVLADQAPRNLDDALYNVSGITQGNNFGGTADTVMKRGFGDNRDGSIMRDGMPLVQIARIGHVWEPGVMWREGRQYAVTVQGDVPDGMQGATVTAEIWPALDKMRADLPPGYDIQIAGAVAESSKGQGSIAKGVPVMLFLTFTLLMLQLQSFKRAMLVFLTGPMGIAGVAAALLLLDRPFGFVALLGVIALMGMIQRNSVILIDQIEQDRAAGVPDRQAVVESAVRRFRPIVLTAAAAVLAMIPLSRSVFWGPMAVAIMGGLIVATALTLLALPAMYAAWFRVGRDGARLG